MSRSMKFTDGDIAAHVLIDKDAETYGILQVGGRNFVRGYKHMSSEDALVTEFRSRYITPPASCACLGLFSIEHSDGFFSIQLPDGEIKNSIIDYLDREFFYLERRYSDGVVKRKFE